MLIRRSFGFPNRGWPDTLNELERMRRQMDDIFKGFSKEGHMRQGSGVFPSINLTEDKDHFYLRAELPGVTSEDLEMEAIGKNITISGTRRIALEKEGAKYHRRERESGKFSRVISLPNEVNTENITAALKDGILTVCLPKAEKAKPRQITIN